MWGICKFIDKHFCHIYNKVFVLDAELYDQSMNYHNTPNQEVVVNVSTMEYEDNPEETSIPQAEEIITKEEGVSEQKVEQTQEKPVVVSSEPEPKKGWWWGTEMAIT